ncbi:MAG: thioredoxin domain-containing protein [Thermodesulfobacteriota bacterium]
MKVKIMIPIGGALLLTGFAFFYFLFLNHPNSQVLAQINDEKISVEEFNRELEKLESPLKEMFREEPQPFLETLILKKLLLQEAKKEGLTPPVITYKDTAKDSKDPEEKLIEDLIKKKFPNPPTVTKEEVKTFYNQLKGQLEGKSFEDVFADIEEILREGKRQTEMRQFIAELRGNAKVEIDQILLKKISAKPPESNSEEDLKRATTSGKPILVDFGANNCLPCRQMRPILKEIRKDYMGKAEILVIDVYKYPHLAREYKIQLIPTLVFFDAKGKEVFRHIGMMDKEKIVSKLKEIGVGS